MRASCPLYWQGASEIFGALAEAECSLESLDVRGNKIGIDHPLVLDERVKAGFQRPASRAVECD